MCYSHGSKVKECISKKHKYKAWIQKKIHSNKLAVLNILSSRFCCVVHSNKIFFVLIGKGKHFKYIPLYINEGKHCCRTDKVMVEKWGCKEEAIILFKINLRSLNFSHYIYCPKLLCALTHETLCFETNWLLQVSMKKLFSQML